MRSRPATWRKRIGFQALARRSEKVDGYEIKFAQDQGAFPGPEWPSRSLDELLESHVQHTAGQRIPGAEIHLPLGLLFLYTKK